MKKVLENIVNDFSLYQEDYFREMIDALPMAIYTTDAEGKLTHFNPAAVRFSGRVPKLGSEQWCITWKLYHSDGTFMPHHTCPMALALKESRSILGKEAIAERPDGKRIHFEAYPSPLCDQDGNIIGGINMLVDITDRKRAEEKVLQSELELSDFFENAMLGIHWVGEDGIITKVNNAELELLGYDKNEYVGQSITKFHADQDVYEDILSRLKKGEELEDYEARLRTKDGDIRHVLINSNVFFENGEFKHTRCLTRDITDRKIAHNELLESKERLRVKAHEMEKLHTLSTQLLLQDDIKTALHAVTSTSVELVLADKASVQIYDEDEDVLKLVSTIGFDPAFDKKFARVNMNDFTTCAATLGKRKQVLVSDLQNDPNFVELSKAAEPYGLKAALSTPLIGSNGQLFGVFTMYWNKPHTPSPDKLQLLELCAHHAARQIERKRSEEALKAREAHLSALIETTPECIKVVAPDGKIVEMNSTGLSMVGAKSPDEVINQSVYNIIARSDRKKFKEFHENVCNGKRGTLKFKIVGLSGKVRHMETHAAPLPRPDGTVCQLAITHDITKRIRSERSNELLSAIISNSNDAIISKGLDGLITSWNSGAEQMFGYSEKEAIGKNISILIPDDRREEESEIINKVKRNEQINHFETIRLRKDGSSVNISLTVSAIRDMDGQVVGASKIARDITSQKQAEKKLHELNQTLEKRVEERTASLLSYQEQLRLLASRLSNAEEFERSRIAGELHDNLGQMLAVGKIRLDQLDLNGIPEETNEEINEIKDLVNEAIRYTRELMSDLKPPPAIDSENVGNCISWVASKMKKHSLNVHVTEDELAKPLDDEIRITLRQCVKELLYNIVKHAGTEDARIELTRNDDFVQVVIEDDGTGFSPAEKRGPSPTGGFGLFNIHERMDLLGGSFEIHSQPGEGVKAVLRAPISESEEKEVATTGNAEQNVSPLKLHTEKNGLEKIKVLLVDDHEMMRKGLQKMIDGQNDLTVIAEAADGKEAVDLAHQTTPDVIVMDVNMPIMDGIEASQRITNDLPHIRIIGLSLHNNHGVADAMRNSGASAYLTKSEAFETLCATIRSEAKTVKMAMS